MDYLLDALKEISIADRIERMEREAREELFLGDFVGSVTGYWLGLNMDGTGLVEYKKKWYTTKPIGFTSLPRGAEVELSYANGTYYSKF